LKVDFTLKNESPGGLRLCFASEWAFNLLAGDAHDRYYESNGKKLDDTKMNSTGNSPQPSNFRLVDEFLQLAITLKPEGAAEVIRYPLESVSLSEAGFERIYQGSIVMPVWNVDIAPGAEWKTTLVVA